MDVVSSTDGDRADFPRLGTRYLLRGDATGGRFAPGGEASAASRMPSGTPGTSRRLLELISPAGFERYFEEMAPQLAGEGPPDFEQLAAIQARYGLTMDRESIGPLSERHGLQA
jgi:hypothetical protein